MRFMCNAIILYRSLKFSENLKMNASFYKLTTLMEVINYNRSEQI